MDGWRFDTLVRTLADVAPRRGVVKALAGAIVAGLLTAADSEAADCRGTDDICERDAQCCSDRCAGGRCDCRRRGARCGRDRECCSRLCSFRGRCY